MESDQQNMHKYKPLWLVCIVLVIFGGASTAFAHFLDSIYHEVTLDDNGYVVQIQTMEKTVEELLNKYEITLGPGDEISPDLEEPIEDGTEIRIDRAFKVTVEADGKVKEVYLTKGTVEDVLKRAQITLGEKDFTNYDLDRQAAPGDHIKITRVKEEILVEKEKIPYRIITKENNKLKKGVEKVVQEGKEGEKERKILIAYYDGVEVKREVVEERIAQEPQNRIIDKGTYVEPPKPVSRGNTSRNKTSSSKTTKSSTSSSKASSNKSSSNTSGFKTFEATAYTHTGNKTRTGIWPKKGIIAVDPKVIPLYTKVYIEFPKGWTHLNGYYQAMDTGGAIKGNIIDVFVEDEATARKFGRRKVKIKY